jgi:hypothetical protein
LTNPAKPVIKVCLPGLDGIAPGHQNGISAVWPALELSDAV